MARKKPKQSPFRKWFVAQFGGYPDERKRSALFAKIHELETALHFAKLEKAKEDWLREAQDAALKAWNASDAAEGSEK